MSAIAETTAANSADPTPASRPADRAMRVLFATDGSQSAGEALELLRRLPLAAGSRVEVVTVVEGPNWLAPSELLRTEQSEACRAFETAKAALEVPGVWCGHAIPSGAAAEQILKAAAAFQAELIIIGTHGRGALGRLLLGSVARNVARHAPRPVLVARQPRNGLRRVVVALDESRARQEVLELVRRFPFPPETQLTLCHVVRPYHPFAALDSGYLPDIQEVVAKVEDRRRAEGRDLLAKAQDILATAGRKAEVVVRQGDPAQEILALAKEQQADLVIAGARGVSAIQGLLVGSVADGLLSGAEISVLLVHGELDEAVTLVEADR
jgi:nucleotide-binding universal stress UspA family protein